MNGYRFERLNESNIVDLTTIYRAAFGREKTLEYFINKFNTHSFGAANLGYLAYSGDGMPAAFYGIFPCIIKYKGERFLSAQSGDTMTHPEHQGKGLFTALAKLTYETAKQEGVKFIFGFPNKNSYPGFTKKLNWQHKEDLQTYLIRVKCMPWQRVKQLFQLNDKSYEKYCHFILKFFKISKKTFKNSVIGENTGGIERSVDFFNYKTYSPNFRIEIKNKTIWLKTLDMFLLIGDLENCDVATFRHIIRRLKLLAFLLGLPHIRFTCSPGSYFESLFASISRKYETTHPIGYLNLDSSFPGNEIKFTAGDSDTF